MLKHSKKRNVGLVSEFLSRHIAACAVANRTSEMDRAKSLWVKSFAKGTELAKEQALFNALYRTDAKNRDMAVSLLEQVKKHSKTQDAKKLYQEKTIFLEEAKRTIDDPQFFTREVTDYRTCATIQILLNAWREADIVKLAETIHLEEQVIEHLVNPNKFAPLDESVLSLNEADINGLVVHVMTEKFNKKYEQSLTDDQKKLINLYVFSKESEQSREALVEVLREVRISTLTYIDYESAHSKDKRVVEKLGKVKGLLEGRYKNIEGNHTDDMITFYMTASKLKEELSQS